MYRGASGYPEWLKVEQRLREQLKWLLNADSGNDIALCKNTSEALSLIAYGLTWRPGDNIVTSDQEFPSNRIVWESLSRAGVELRQADISGHDPEGAMLALCDERTRLLTVSSVQYASGLRMDLPILGEYCRHHSILFCIDAIQSLGALAFDLRACGADFVVADAHKWLSGPEGLALFYSSPQARDQLHLQQYGWHMVEHVGDFDRLTWAVASSARRFEPGSPNMLGIHALHASLTLFEEVGMAVVERQVLACANRLMNWIESQAGLQLVTPHVSQRYAGIVSFRCRELDAVGHMRLWQMLMRAGVICACRGGAIRLSPHFYSDIDQFAAIWSQVRTGFR